MAVRSRVFIGSSAEGLDPARAIQANLAGHAEARVWDQGVIVLSQAVIEGLIEVLDWADFGVFVFTPDDLARIKGQDVAVPRDNVLFELGLFTGRLGRQRSFFVQPLLPTELHLPSDLLGVISASYNAKPSDLSGLQAALGPATMKIRAAMQNALKLTMPGQDVSPRLIYLLRHMAASEGEWLPPQSYALPLAAFPQYDGGPPPKLVGSKLLGWEKAAEYACRYLATLRLIEFAMSHVHISARGKEFLAEPKGANQLPYERALINLGPWMNMPG